MKRWCVFCKDNIFFCLDFGSKKEALSYIRDNCLGSNYFVSISYILPL